MIRTSGATIGELSVGGFVDDDPRKRVDVAFPWLFGEHPSRMLVTGLPTRGDAGSREVDVLGVVITIEI